MTRPRPGIIVGSTYFSRIGHAYDVRTMLPGVRWATVASMTDTIDLASTASTATSADDPMAFASAFTTWMNGGTIILGIDAGHRAGVFEALAAAGPSTSEELARCAGFSERELREWLGLMTVAGIVAYDPATQRYRLPAGPAMCLTGDTSFNVAPVTRGLAVLAVHVEAVARSLRAGGGIPYAAFRPEFTDLMDAMNRRLYDEVLVDGYIDMVAGLRSRLESGIRVADIGCGTGHVVNLLARAFPASTFVGYDLAEDALAAARAEAREYGVTNATFESADVAALPSTERFDLVLAFDAIHDQAAPRTVLAGINAALADEGIFVMVDIHASSNLEENIAHPMGPWLYGASLFHCMQVSLAEGGEGLGTVWGVELATELLHEAGFSEVTMVGTPDADVTNTMFVCRR